MALFSQKSWDDWINEYSKSHQHPVNRVCHIIGIPTIVISLVIAPMALLAPTLWQPALALFLAGWVFQFIGHFYEKKPPEFFKDWRFLLVGTRWWIRKTFSKRGC